MDPTIGLETGAKSKLFTDPRVHFYNVGLLGHGLTSGEGFVLKTLPELMVETGHRTTTRVTTTQLDVLKVDIEGWEWGVFDSFFRKKGDGRSNSNPGEEGRDR